MSEPTLLDRGEKLLWTGQPNPPRYALAKSWHTLLFGVFFFGFAVFWTYGANKQSGSSFALLGVPFLLIGAGMLFSPFWHLLRGMRATYALTDRRAIIDISGLIPRRTSIPLHQIRFIDMRYHAGDWGDIYFKETATSDGDGYTIRREGFIATPEVRRAEQLLRKAIEQVKDSGRP